MWYMIIIDAMCEQRTGQKAEPYSPHFEAPWPLHETRVIDEEGGHLI